MYHSPPFKFIISNVTNKAVSILIFLYPPLHKNVYTLRLTDWIYNSLVTLSSLNSENVSTMMPNTMFRPMVVTMMKKVKSKKTDLKAASLKFVDKLVVCACTTV